MSWAYGKNAEGREIGYGVEAICDYAGCSQPIDRGISFVCGGMHDGGDHGCGGYFCDAHLFFVGGYDLPQRCSACCDATPAPSLEVEQ